MESNSIYKTPQDLLPVELWIKIINHLDHFPSQLLTIQNVCQLFWNIIQEEYVAKGKLKSDYFEIRRPFSDNLQENHDENLDSVFLFMSEDRLNIKCSRPCWFLGAGFHGPYSTDKTSIKNLKISLTLKSEERILNKREKLCKVKFPEVILPIFLDKPSFLEPLINYTISMDFDFKNAYLNIRGYLIEYRGHEEIKSDFNQFQFDEPKCLKPDSSCKCAYVQCGHIRDLYFWPCEN